LATRSGLSGAPAIGLETWRGSVRPWHIDEMGHMNVRYYLAAASESLTGLAGALGMPRAFAKDSQATLRPREHHVRFLHEARLRAALHIECAILEMGETEAHILQVMLHSETREPAAAITSRVEHVTAREMRPFPFSKATRRLAAELQATAPDYALPRGLADPSRIGSPSLVRADRLGLIRTGLGALTPADADVFGLMPPEHMLERISQSMAHQLDRAGLPLAEHMPQMVDRLGGATVELRQTYHRWPRIGDRLELRSGLSAVTAKTARLCHWLLDPHTGQAWAEADMLTVNLDLVARKAVVLPEPLLDILRRRLIPATPDDAIKA
jgi:acyl-CoA thioester hydrolase